MLQYFRLLIIYAKKFTRPHETSEECFHSFQRMFWFKKKINTVLAEERGGASKSLGWRGTGSVHKQSNVFSLQNLSTAISYWCFVCFSFHDITGCRSFYDTTATPDS